MAILRGALTNLGKYSEGELDWTWLSFPCTQEQIDSAMKKIGIGEDRGDGYVYEEYFFTDWDTDEDWVSPDDLGLGEYIRIEDVNELAEKLQDIKDNGQEDAFEAACKHYMKVEDAIDNIDDVIFISDNSLGADMEMEVAEYYTQDGLEYVEHPEYYFDYDSFGRDVRLEYHPEEEGDPETAGEYWCGDKYASDQDIGYEVVEQLYGDVENISEETRETYFDYAAYGRDLCINGTFIQTKKGIFEICNP